MMQKLGDIATYINGYAFKPADRGLKGLPIIRIQDLTGNSYDLGFYDGIYPKKIEINNGDILISWSGSLGIFLWNGGKALLNQHIFKVVFDKKDIDKHYFLFAVKEKLNEMSLKTHGATMKHIIKSDFENITISLPDLNEQKRISNMLLKIENLIKMRKNQIQHYDTLTKSLFVELFGDPSINTNKYPIKSLSEIAEYWNGLTYKPCNVTNKGITVLRSSNIKQYKLNFDDIVRVDCNISPKKYVQNNDILMCSRNGSSKLVGKVALIKDITEPMSFGAFMMIIRSPYYSYLMTYFQLPNFRKQISTGATTTINQITKNMLDSVKLPVPHLSEINRYAQMIDYIDKHKFPILD